MLLPFGKNNIEFTPFPGIDWQVLETPAQQNFSPEMEVVESGVEKMIALLKPRYRENESVLVIIPDHTRKCRLPIVLPLLVAKMKKELQTVPRFLIANGSHVLQPENIIRELVGNEIFDNYQVEQHDAKDDSALTELGVTSAGTQLRMNSKALQADHVLTVNGILYHYFAGFGGGPKMLLPGVAGYETIRQNHSRTIDRQSSMFHDQCFNGNLATNPVYQDLKEVLNYFPDVISLQFALSTDGKIVQAEAGPVIETQAKIVERVKALYAYPITQKADIVVASAGGFPSDVNLVQTHKAIHHAFMTLKPGGVLVVAAECDEGIGSATFMPYFDFGNSKAMGERLTIDYKINGQTALALKMKAEQATILFVSNLDEDLVIKTGMLPIESMEVAGKWIAENAAPLTDGYIIPKANLTVPVLNI